MQTVSAAFTAEEHDSVRKITQSVQVAWKKSFDSSIRFFTIGVSTIGGSDVIPAPDSSPSSWNKYQYTDESANVVGLAYERELLQPIGGLSSAMAEVDLDNTNGRYTPRVMGGTAANSEIFTAVQKPQRPFIINAGFNYGGIDNNIPQFVGLTDRPPKVDIRSRSVKMQGTDWIGFLQSKYVDRYAMFTGQRTDQIIESSLSTLGFSTAQYELDTGINIVNFAEIQPGDKWGNFINKLVQAEDGIFWQDDNGKLHFQNRQAWDSSPYNAVQKIITTAQVINQASPSYDHIINVVEIKSKPREKQPNQLVFTLSGTKELPSGNTEMFIDFDDPMLSIDNPVYVANTAQDGSGADITSNITLKSLTKFSKSCKIVFNNNSASSGFITNLTIYGRPAKVAKDIYIRKQDDSSVTAYSEHRYEFDNEYIGNTDWANSFAQVILNDYAEPENLQEITIHAIPELQLGDLISWQGRYWRIFGLKTLLDSASGFVQQLKLLQRTPTSYFRIGISTIGGSDKIAP